jgi:hypothetical protein
VLLLVNRKYFLKHYDRPALKNDKMALSLSFVTSKFNLMKTKNLLMLLFMAAVLSTACSRKVVIVKSTPARHIPPGQAKKMGGSTSAKPYAPGQKKKG